MDFRDTHSWFANGEFVEPAEPGCVLASPVVILAGGAFSLLCWAVLGLYLLR